MKKMLSVLILFSFFTAGITYSQNIFSERGHLRADSLTEVTVSGTIIINTNYAHPVYFLDENNDGLADIHLNFGPWWYYPDSSDAVRPNSGDVVTITGGMHESKINNYNVIVVYEIDGKFWREPFNPFWNNFTENHRRLIYRHNNCNSSSFGWNHDSLITVNITGSVMIDSTFFVNHYYLDVNNDQVPDYFLNFGPYWYEAESGVVRPSNGETVTIVGAEIKRTNISTIIVFEINGLIWREQSNFGNNLGGGWIHDNMSDSSWFHNPYDSLTRIKFSSGWRKGGHQGGMMSDSLYCRLLEIYPENLPNSSRLKIFASFEIGMYSANGMNYMRNNSNCGGKMSFGSAVRIQLHYSHKQLENYGVNESSICLKYWDDSIAEYVTINNAVIDYNNNTVTYSSSDIHSYVVLAENEATGVNDVSQIIDNNYKLYQNYPNPFNPSTTIEFSIPVSNYVNLSVYDILGREVKVLVNNNLSAGVHSISFDASGLSSGVYFYKLKSGESLLVRKLNLLK